MAANKKVEFSSELGVTGLKYSMGRIYEEWDRSLVGPKAMRVYREMEQCPAVGACLGAIEMQARDGTLKVEPPPDASQEELLWAEHVRTCLGDMSFSWDDTLTEILSMLQFGFAPMEVVWKRRGGDVNDPASRSRYSDGLIGWRKFAIRGQETVTRWDLDPNGGIQAVYQQAAPDYKERRIPIDKMLLFRPKVAKNNPEGRSVLRSAYRSYFFWKQALISEGIGMQRNLEGFPVMGIPAACFLEDATAEQKATLEAARKLVTSIGMDEQRGAVIPIEYLPGTNSKLYDLSILQNGSGKSQVNTSEIIRQRQREVVVSMIYDLMLIGEPNTLKYQGNRPPEFFAASVDAWLESIAAIFNAIAIPDLYRMNGWPIERTARLCFTRISPPDLAGIGDFITKTVAAGALFPEGLDAYLRGLANFPPAPEGAKARELPAATPPAPAPDKPSTDEPPVDEPAPDSTGQEDDTE